MTCVKVMVRAWITFRTFAAVMTKFFAALTFLLISTTTVWGQFTYHDFNDTTVAANGGFADVDFNADGKADLRFTLLRDTGTTGQLSVVHVHPLDSARINVAGQKRGAYHYPDRLAVGDSISRTSSLWQGVSSPTYIGYLDYRFAGQHDPYVQWQAPYTDGFLAVRRNVKDSVVYGWVRLSIAADGKSFTLKDAGYQAAYDSVMFAGHLWIGLDTYRSLEGYSWRQASDRIVLLRPAAQTARSFRVVDAGGRVLAKGIWQTGEDLHLPTDFFTPGTYWFLSEGAEGPWHFTFQAGSR